MAFLYLLEIANFIVLYPHKMKTQLYMFIIIPSQITNTLAD
jgi:hypothetical protein